MRYAREYFAKKSSTVIAVLIFITVAMLSIGYSAFSSRLNISNIELNVGLQKDIRITGISVVPETDSTSICTLQSGTEGAVGSSYSCDLGESKKSQDLIFYVLEEGTDSTYLIMNQNINSDGSIPVSGVNESVSDIYDLVGYSQVATFLKNATTDWTELESNQILLPTKAQIEDVYTDTMPLWLYEQANNQVSGYWTSTLADDENVWSVDSSGDLTVTYITTDDVNGVRPVILIPTSQLNSNEEDGINNNGGTTSYTQYNVSNISAGIDLPNENSSITFNVEVTNIEATEMGILEITGLPSNLEYELLNYNLKDKICDSNNKCSLGIKKEIQIRIKYKDGGYDSSNTKYNVVADFNFQPYYTVTYTNIDNNEYPSEIIGGDTLSIDFGTGAPETLKVYIDSVETTDFTYENGKLTIEDVNSNIEIINPEKSNPLTVVANTLTYTGSAQELVKVENVEGTVYYSTSTELTSENYSSAGSTTISKATNAGTYKVYYYTPGTETYQSTSGIIDSIIISKKTLAVEKLTYSPITKEYDGTTTVPIGFKVTATTDSGLVNGDTVTVSYTSAVYNDSTVANANSIVVTGLSLSGSDATNYSLTAVNYTKTGATITNVKDATTGSCETLTYNGSEQTLVTDGENVTYKNNTGTNAGEYQVTVTPKTNYAWSDGTTTVKTLTCTIAQKEVTYTADSVSKTYDGSALTKSSATLTSGTLVTGHTATFTVSGTITNVGSVTNTLSDVVIKSGTTDVSSNYKITKVNGSLTVTKRGLIIDAYSATYTGEKSFTRTYSTGVNEEALKLTYAPYASTSGDYEYATTLTSGKYTLAIADGTGKASNYFISSAGKFTISRAKTATTGSCKTLTYNGSAQVLASGATNATYTNNGGTNAGSYTVTVTPDENYAWSDGTYASKTLTCSIGKKALTIDAYSATYTGGTSFTRTYSTGVNDETLKLTYAPYASTSGDYEYATTEASGKYTLAIADGTGKASNYSISSAGKFTISRAKTATTGSCKTLTYNGSAQVLASGATNATYTNNGGTDAKSYTVTVTPNANYAWSDGTTTAKTLTCTIGQKEVTYKADDASKTYDGSALTKNSATLTSGTLVTGHTATFTVSGTITNVGSVTNTLSDVVIKSGTTDVSSNYKITKTNGTLTVTKKALTIDAYIATYTGEKEFERTYSTGVNSENIKVTYSTYSANAGDYEYATTLTSGKYVLILANGTGQISNYSIGSAGTFTIKKVDPILTLSATSGTVVAGKTLSFTVKGNLVGDYTITSSDTSKATVSPATITDLAANTASTVTVTGVASGSSTITVKYTPNDTTNYNAVSKTYIATITNSATIPTAASYCSTPTYTGTSQTIVKTAGTGYTWTAGTTGTNAGSYTVTATLASGYRWSDNTTGTKTISCTIKKADPTLTLSATSGTVVAGKTLSFTVKGNLVGDYTITSSDTSKATVSPATITDLAANTASTVTVTGVASGSSTITVKYTPNDTTNYNAVSKTYTATITNSATIPTAASYCSTPTYTGSSQTIVKTAGTGYTWTAGTTGTNAGSYTVTATLASGYRWSDNTTGTKTISCSIAKATSTCTISAVPTLAYPGAVTGNITYSCTGDGTRNVTSSNTDVISVGTVGTTSTALTAKSVGDATISVSQAEGTNYKASSAVTKDITVSASNYTVTYNANGGYAVSTSSATVAYNSAVSLTPTASRTGYTFVGWNTSSTATTKLSSYTMPGNNVTLYAVWSIDSHTLKVNPNGGTYNSSTSTTTYTKNYGSTQTIATPTRTGYTFGGWVPTKVSGTDSATWARVFYHNNSGGTSLYSSESELNSTNTINKFSILGQLESFRTDTSSSFEFLLDYDELGSAYNRWKQTSNPTTSSTISGYSAVSLSWTANSWGGIATSSTTSSTFIDGSPSASTWFYAIGSKSSWNGGIPGPSAAIKERQSLWVKADSDLSNISKSITGVLDSSNNYIVRDDITLTANWIPNSYSVTYDCSTNGGTGNTSASVVYGNAVDLSKTCTKSGWTFVGWNTSSTATSKLSSLTMGANDVTLYAIYKKEAVTLKADWNANGATLSSTTQSTCQLAAVYNTATQATSCTVTAPTITRSGYNIIGFATSASATTKSLDNAGTLTLTSSNTGKTWYAITSKNVGNLTITLSATSYSYNGVARTPTVTVKDGDTTLTKDTDYTVSYSNNTNAGTATVTITGKNVYNSTTKTIYTSSTSKTFTISKITPTVTLSATSGTVVAGKTMSFTATTKSSVSVAGTLKATSSATGVATVSPASTSITATSSGVNISETITGVASGSSTITVTFTPTDTTNFNSATATYSATITKSATIPTNSLCVSRTYTGSAQQLTSVTSGTGYTLSGYSKTNAGSYTITATLASGYRWSDNTTGTKTFSCSIAKATPYLYIDSSMEPLEDSDSDDDYLVGYYDHNVTSIYVQAWKSSTDSTLLTGDFKADDNSNLTWDSDLEFTSTTTAQFDFGVEEENYESYDGIYVTFTPSDTTNYNTISRQYIYLALDSVYPEFVDVGSLEAISVSMTSGKTATITSRTADNSGIDYYVFCIKPSSGNYSCSSGSTPSKFESSSIGTYYESSKSFSSLTSGATYSYYVTVYDKAGNYSTSDTKTFTMPSLSGSVKITGNNTVGSTLTASVTNSSSATLSYQWYYNSSNSTSGGTAISGATSSTYTVPSTYAGKYIYVVVTMSKTNYDSIAVSDITDATNNKTAILKTVATIPTAANYCYSRTYTGSSQTLVKTAGTGYTWTAGTTRTNAGSQNVTATLSTNYIWSDYTTGTKSISCSIAKATPYLYIEASTGELDDGDSDTDYLVPSYNSTTTGIFVTSYTNSGMSTELTGDFLAEDSTGGMLEWDDDLEQTSTSYASYWIGVNEDDYESYGGIYVTFTPQDTTNYNTVKEYVYLALDSVYPEISATASVSGTTATITATATDNSGIYDYYYCMKASTANSYSCTWSDSSTKTYSSLTAGTTYYYYVGVEDNAWNYTETGVQSFSVAGGTLSGSVKVTGTNTWGNTLTASVTNTNSATLKYQWYYNSSNSTSGGTAISGATSSTYTVPSTYIGKYIYVVVTATKTNYTTTTWKDITDATNNSTATVNKKDPVITIREDSSTGDIVTFTKYSGYYDSDDYYLINPDSYVFYESASVTGDFSVSSNDDYIADWGVGEHSEVDANSYYPLVIYGMEENYGSAYFSITFTPADTSLYNEVLYYLNVIAAPYLSISVPSGYATSKSITIPEYNSNFASDYTIQYSTDGSTWKTYSGTAFTVTANGTVYARVYSSYSGTYTSQTSASVTGIDTTTPITTAPTLYTRSTSTISITRKQTDSESGISGWYAQYSTDNSTWTNFASTAYSGSVTTATITGLTPNKTYYFRTVSTNGAGKSSTSAVLTSATLNYVHSCATSSVTATGYTVKCTVDSSVKQVRFPTWTTSGGQDDLIWHVGTVSGTTVSYSVKVADHNYESGAYTTHVYVYNSSGTQLGSAVGVSATVPEGSYTYYGEGGTYNSQLVLEISGKNNPYLTVADVSYSINASPSTTPRTSYMTAQQLLDVFDEISDGATFNPISEIGLLDTYEFEIYSGYNSYLTVLTGDDYIYNSGSYALQETYNGYQMIFSYDCDEYGSCMGYLDWETYYANPIVVSTVSK